MISNTLHALEVFTTPITTFEVMPDRQKTIVPTNLQILSQVELVEVISVEHVEEITSQPVIEG